MPFSMADNILLIDFSKECFSASKMLISERSERRSKYSAYTFSAISKTVVLLKNALWMGRITKMDSQ